MRTNIFSLPLAGRVRPKGGGGGRVVRQDRFLRAIAALPDPHPTLPAEGRESHLPRKGKEILS